MNIGFLFALIFINGLFAAAEIALMTARKARLQAMVEQGDGSAEAAIRLGEDPNRFLSTIQIGLTLIGLLNGIIGEAALAVPFAAWLISMGLSDQASHIIATASVVIGITYFTIVLGELVPKRIGQIRAEALARAVARPMLGLSLASKPFVRLLSSSTDLMLRLFGVDEKDAPAVTEEEIHALIAEGSDAGVIEDQEHQMLRNVFRLDDRAIASLMVPRGDIVYLDIQDGLDENLKRVAESEHTRFPVLDGGFEHVLGIAHSKQLLGQSLRGEPTDLSANLQPPVFVPESLTGMELLEHFKTGGVQLAFVIDEYGEVIGIVTLQDLMEAITGEFRPRSAEDSWAVQREDGSWLLDGIIPVPEMKDCLALKSVPEEEKGRYNTLAGMLMLLLGRLPQTGDHCVWEGWRFEIVDLDGKRIDKVLASIELADEESESGTAQP